MVFAIVWGVIDIFPSQVKTAYRKKALTCHPDKNPDNPAAAAEFLRLSKILEILTDDAAKVRKKNIF